MQFLPTFRSCFWNTNKRFHHTSIFLHPLTLDWEDVIPTGSKEPGTGWMLLWNGMHDLVTVSNLWYVVAKCCWTHEMWRQIAVIQAAAKCITSWSTSHMVLHVPWCHVWRHHIRGRRKSSGRAYKACTQRLSNTKHTSIIVVTILQQLMFTSCTFDFPSDLFQSCASSMDKWELFIIWWRSG